MQSISDWRCHACGKLLGKVQGNQIQIKITDKGSYVVDGKVIAVCPRCAALNSTQTAEIVPVSK